MESRMPADGMMAARSARTEISALPFQGQLSSKLNNLPVSECYCRARCM
jgi:hypothetical protein